MNTMFIGKSKTGHTRCLETLPRGVVDFSFDKEGWMSIRKKNIIIRKSLREWMIEGKKLAPNDFLVIDYFVSDPILADKYIGYSTLMVNNFILDFNELWKPATKGRGICHVALDSLTWMQFPVLEYIIATQNRVTSSQNDYGLAINKIKEIISSGAGLPQDFILTSHIQSDKDQVTGEIKEEPLIYGKALPDVLVSAFSTVFTTTTQLTATGPKYVWGTQPTPYFKSVGTRLLDNLPAFIDPDFEKWFSKFLYREEEPPNVQAVKS